MEDGQGKQDQDPVREPGFQSSEVEALRHVVGVEKLEDVEVEEIKAVAALADQEKGTPGEQGGDGVGTAEAEDESSEDRRHEATVHQQVRGVADKVVEEDSYDGEADGGEDEALARSDDEGKLQFAEGDSGEESADVGERGVLEEPYKFSGTVAVDGADDVVRVQVEIEGVGDEADDPKADSNWKTFDDPRPEMREPGFDRTPIANPLVELLRYEGSYSVKAALHYPGYTIQWYAVFEATKPGRFNLEVTAANASPTAASSAQPIIVVAPGAPVTMVVAQEKLRFFSKRKHGQARTASSSGNSYVTDFMILQPGDRISLPYHTFTRNLQYERRFGTSSGADPTGIKPVIIVHPFSLDPNYNINEWLIDHLPK